MRRAIPLRNEGLQRLRASGALHRVHRPPEQPPVGSSGAYTVIRVPLCYDTSSFIFAFCIFVCLICIHVCIYVCVCRYTCMHVCECMWGPEVVVWCLPQCLSTLYTEVEALMNLEFASLIFGFSVSTSGRLGLWKVGFHDHTA